MLLKTRGQRAFGIVNVILMILLSACFVIPAWLIVSASFSSNLALTKYGYTFFIKEFSLDAYIYIFTAQKLFLTSILNSIFITVVGTGLAVLVSALYAYALSKRRLVGKKFFSLYLIFTMLFAGGIIPYYLVVGQMLKLENTLWAIILPGIISAWNVILMRNFFMGIPDALSESAAIDGANNFVILFRIIMPVSFPVVATVILYTAVGFWNNWFGPMLFLKSEFRHLYPVQALLREMLQSINNVISAMGGGSTANIPAEGVKNASIVVATLPIVIVYPFLQKYFINGVILGSVKE